MLWKREVVRTVYIYGIHIYIQYRLCVAGWLSIGWVNESAAWGKTLLNECDARKIWGKWMTGAEWMKEWMVEYKIGAWMSEYVWMNGSEAVSMSYIFGMNECVSKLRNGKNVDEWWSELDFHDQMHEWMGIGMNWYGRNLTMNKKYELGWMEWMKHE